ncbi:transcription-repair coupling factor [Candidatus Peregrinibacteria bacterium CG10_big_fil_rev_8_21_14_0_10_36_19]|nr:MAG: transcription-repair coupling factor [Candidatus Peregrinibacteria bacterium CG10_big_fil_rev_8_21_14_0_10_36_19]
MRDIVSFFPKEELKEATDLFGRSKNISYSGSGNASSKSMLVSDIFRNYKDVGRTLWVVSDSNEPPVIRKSMEMWGDRNVYVFKSKNDSERLSYSSFNEFKRAKAIDLVEFVSNIYQDRSGVFIVDFESLLEDFPDVDDLFKNKFSVVKGEKFDVVKFIEKLVSTGYEVTNFGEVNKGEYFRIGDSLIVHPVNSSKVIRIEVNFDEIEGVFEVDDVDYSKKIKELKFIDIVSINYARELNDILDIFGENDLVIDDEVDVIDEHYDLWNKLMEKASNTTKTVSFTTFNDDVSQHYHLHFLSVLKYRNGYDLANDFRDKISAGWNILFFTKNVSDMRGLLTDQSIPFMVGITDENFSKSSVFLIEVDKDDSLPISFQAPKQKILLITDFDISQVRDEKRKVTQKNVFDDFLTSLKFGDYVVHADHGIAKFLGLDQKTVDNVTKEYLKLGYAENDKLFVPIDQADKVNKYIGSEDLMPKLTRLGSAEWNTLTSRVKKETQKIAKELLKLYAERKTATGRKFIKDSPDQKKFEETFIYEETPGQIKAIEDVKADMESPYPMDRLVCGDVGFGKTEVAMRAAFKAVKSGAQVAVISPITILADQHYKSFKKRMDEFHVRVEMLSRFRSAKEQTEIVKKLKKGEIDIIVGTHRLLQPDIEFKDLGLVIVDEEQRFGVKQKEKLKEMKKDVDILTLTATPIPRTLNICLNKLRDITTITTPPYGRLPIITEVRKYSPSLVREAIMKELDRGGQVYFLHNRVQTIDSFAEKIQALVPEAKVGVAHGQLGSGDLEERILAFTEGRYNVLVSSTIIENGIDLANANTLIVNNAEKFGLSQLYQLRGRVGRGKAQAYAYFLYHGQRLKLDAKKRLRAIVEASELGSGFQIAMKDLEIRGAGDILGANQHGVINVVGVSHFMRMLNKAVEDLKAGRIMEGTDEIEDVSVELPVPSYIPDSYIADSREKIGAYQKLSSASDVEYLNEVKEEMIEDFGKMPIQVSNLFKIIELKLCAKQAGLLNIKAESIPMSKDKEIVLYMSKKVKPANIVSLLENNPNWKIVGTRLRINTSELGDDWFKALQDDVSALAVEKKHGK